tara:strand:+ start:620 stop:817 length:198 start_codon:yes stop_codon:yes gene_type:complete
MKSIEAFGGLVKYTSTHSWSSKKEGLICFKFDETTGIKIPSSSIFLYETPNSLSHEIRAFSKNFK